jgi:hypothetical protein
MPPAHAPYRDAAADAIYHLLFADDPAAFAPTPGAAPAPWQSMLFATPADVAGVRALAGDPTQESRVRALACLWLRSHGEAVPPKVLFGVIVEVPQDGGLDTLAAYGDGGVRFLHHTGRMTIVEGPLAALEPHVRRILAAAAPIVARIGPWDQPRLPPPGAGRIRLSFLVSDGLYFGEGPMPALAADPLAGPLITHATALLQAVVALRATRGESDA